jgi:ribose transport system ATP-binding protein
MRCRSSFASGKGNNAVASTPNALAIENLSKSFAGNPALSRLDLSVAPGEVHALVGHNGSGKSTLIKILSGYHTPDPGGSVWVGGKSLHLGSPDHSYRLGCRFVHQDLGLIGTASILDNLAFGAGYPTRLGTIRRRAALADAEATLKTVGLHADPRAQVSALGAAQRTELAVARALRHNVEGPPHVLVLDEPTAALPTDEVDRLLRTIRSVAAAGVGVLFVTHHVDEVFRIADRVTVLRNGTRVGTTRIEDTDRPTLVTHLAGENADEVTRTVDAGPDSPSPPVLEVERLSAGPLDKVSFSARSGEILGLAGLTGSGRETALAAAFGAIPRDGGQVLVNGRPLLPARPDRAVAAGMAFLPGDRKAQAGVMSLSATENLTLANLRPYWRRLRLRRGQEAREAATWFTRLAVQPSGAGAMQLSGFSGGNQQKILLGKWLRLGLPMFLAESPTQGVDIGAKAELHHQLITAAQRGAAVVVSSTDIEELITLCSRVLVLWKGRITDELAGNRLSLNVITHAMVSGPESRQGGLQ